MSETRDLPLVDYPLRKGLLGDAALVLWGNVSGEEHLFNHWYTHEHLPERMALPGFLRARRYMSDANDSRTAGWRYFTLYEVESAATLTSAPYLAVLNEPTPATRRCLPLFASLRRTACRVTHSRAWGQGGHVIVTEFGPKPDQEAALRDWIVGPFSSDIARRSSYLALHLLEADADGTNVARNVSVYDNVPTAAGRWLVILEGAWTEPSKVLDRHLSGLGEFEANGASPDHTTQMFRLFADMSQPRA